MSEPPARIPRRTLLRMGLGGLALTPIIAACSGASTTGTLGTSTSGAAATGASASAKSIKKGGALRLGMSGGSAASSLDPQVQPDEMSAYPALMIFDQLTAMNPQFELVYNLAEEFSHNADGTVWTAKLRSGVTWHDGKPFTAADVAYSFNRVINPKTGATSGPQLAMIQSVEKVDALTAKFNLNQPCGWLDIAVGDSGALAVVPAGFNPAKPVGTGPFTYAGWVAGVSANFNRNPNYWGQVPYVDSVALSNIQDDSARFNALLSDQIDLCANLTPAQIAQLNANLGYSLYNSPSGGFAMISMRTDTGPLADNRIRQAIKLCLDRNQINVASNGGYGQLGSDLYGIEDPAYDHSLVRKQDIAAATKLVEQSGKKGETLTLIASNIAGGVISMCQVVAQNIQAIGLNVNVKTVDPATLFGPNYLSWDFSVDIYPATTILTTSAIGDGPVAGLNETHWHDKEYDNLWYKASQEFDPTVRAGYLHQMQEIIFNSGGWLIPTFANVTGAYKNLAGLQNDVTGFGLTRNLNYVGFTA